MNIDDQRRLDKLTATIGSEPAVRDELASVEAEISKLETALAPLQKKRTELTDRLVGIAAAKAEAARIKRAAK